MPRKKLGEILLDAGVLDAQGLRSALAEQLRWGGPLGRHLVDMKLIREETLIGALSKQLGVPAVDLDKWQIPAEVVGMIDSETALNLSAVPFQLENKFLDVAMGDPANLSAVDELQILTKKNVRPYVAGPKALERAIAKYYQRGIGRALDIGRDDDAKIELAPAYDLEAVRPRQSPTASTQAAEIRALQERISRLEALIARDEDVLRKLLALLIEKGVATRDEIADRLR